MATLVAAVLAVLLPATSAARAQPLTVSAASSLADVMAEVGRAWQQTGAPGIVVNAGGSNVLARQIAQGAPVDVFVSADRAQMAVAEASGRIVAGSVRDVLSNTLVLIVPRGRGDAALQPLALADPGVRRLALGNPESVPAGVYARQWLERLGLWEQVAAKVVPSVTVRAALAAVRAGRVDAGVVFATDAMTAPDVVITHRVAPGDAPPITYPAAVVRGDRQDESSRFVAFLSSPQARAIFEGAGFAVVLP